MSHQLCQASAEVKCVRKQQQLVQLNAYMLCHNLFAGTATTSQLYHMNLIIISWLQGAVDNITAVTYYTATKEN
jgi:hypothetical protein